MRNRTAPFNLDHEVTLSGDGSFTLSNNTGGILLPGLSPIDDLTPTQLLALLPNSCLNGVCGEGTSCQPVRMCNGEPALVRRCMPGCVLGSACCVGKIAGRCQAALGISVRDLPHSTFCPITRLGQSLGGYCVIPPQTCDQGFTRIQTMPKLPNSAQPKRTTRVQVPSKTGTKKPPK